MPMARAVAILDRWPWGSAFKPAEGVELATVSALLGHGTTLAEYGAAIADVRKAIEYGTDAIELRMDSH